MKKLNTKKLAYLTTEDGQILLACLIDKVSKDEAKKFIKLVCEEIDYSVADFAESAYVQLDNEDDDYDTIPEAKLLDMIATILVKDRMLEMSNRYVFFADC